MKNYLWIGLVIFVFSCSRNSISDNTFLTKVKWTAQYTDEDNKPIQEVCQFSSDGNYKAEYGSLQLHGKWQWTKDGEILLSIEELSSENAPQKLDNKINYYLKVVELSDSKLKIIERYESDAIDSGFAKEKIFSSEKI